MVEVSVVPRKLSNGAFALDNAVRAKIIRGMAKNLLGWTDIPVTDLTRATAFYSKVLDAPVTAQDMDGYKFALLPQKGVSGCLAETDDSKPGKDGPLVYLSVDGRLDAAVACVSANGGELLQPKHQIGPYGFRAVVIDSEGNRIALHSETA